jgi:hypothetical protein
VPKQLPLPRSNFVVGVGRETTVTTTVVSTKASSIGTTTEATVEAASITSKASISTSRSIVTEATTEATTTKTVIGLIVSAIVPLNVVRVVGLELLEEVGNLLLGLNQDLAEVLSNVVVAVVEEGSSLALVANTRSTADAVDVLGDTVVLS